MNANNPGAPRFDYLDPQQRAFDMARKAAILREETMLSWDGAPLRVYETGPTAAPVVVLFNPLGISTLFMINLAARLAARFRVITWESRGLPTYTEPQPGDDWSLESHCRDLQSILRQKNCDAESMVTFCSGANVAVYGLSRGMWKTNRLCLISPSLAMGPEPRKTDYQRSVLPLWGKIAQEGVRMAALVRVLLQQSERKFDDQADYELSVINNLPFQKNEHTFRYAQLHAPCVAFDCRSPLASLTVPTLLIHGEDDDTVHADSVIAIARALPDARLQWMNEGGHFAIYKSPKLQDTVVDFVSGHGDAAGRDCAGAAESSLAL
jgi:pimeloyl-ACP methyl ester carboxylesterase